MWHTIWLMRPFFNLYNGSSRRNDNIPLEKIMIIRDNVNKFDHLDLKSKTIVWNKVNKVYHLHLKKKCTYVPGQTCYVYSTLVITCAQMKNKSLVSIWIKTIYDVLTLRMLSQMSHHDRCVITMNENYHFIQKV